MKYRIKFSNIILSVIFLACMCMYLLPATAQSFFRRPSKAALELHWIGRETAIIHVGNEVLTVLKKGEHKNIPVEVDIPLSLIVEIADRFYHYEGTIQFSSIIPIHYLYVWIYEDKVRIKQQTQEEYEIEIRKRTSALQELHQNMVLIEGGSFMMGCTKEQASCEMDEKPVRRVQVADFYMSRFEVTQKQWHAVMTDYFEQFEVFDCDDCAAYFVSWNDVNEFIRRLNKITGKNYRLPTEAEWEYAARGGKQSQGFIYSGSNTLADVGWYNINSNKRVNPVGLKKPNEIGLYDMTGNVYEWCADWYGLYKAEDTNNPQGVHYGTMRVIRGGAWSGIPRFARNSYRDKIAPDTRNANIGFRIVR